MSSSQEKEREPVEEPEVVPEMHARPPRIVTYPTTGVLYSDSLLALLDHHSGHHIRLLIVSLLEFSTNPSCTPSYHCYDQIPEKRARRKTSCQLEAARGS